MSKKAIVDLIPALGTGPTTVFNFDLSNSINSDAWQAFTSRQVIANADLLTTAAITSSVTVSFQFAAGTSATITDFWIGNWTGTNADYDGNQVRLTFSGSTSVAVSGLQLITSDAVAFTFNPGSHGIVLSLYGATGTINLKASSGFDTATHSWYSPSNTAGTTAPSLTSNVTQAVYCISKVVMT